MRPLGRRHLRLHNKKTFLNLINVTINITKGREVIVTKSKYLSTLGFTIVVVSNDQFPNVFEPIVL